jgi:predicted O-methyltransferase YrrM
MADGYEFTADWFVRHEPVWRAMIEQHKPARIVEIGSYEGRSAAFLVEACAAHGPLELHCIDTWQGGVDNDASGMAAVEARFDRNLAHALRQVPPGRVSFHKHKGLSRDALARLLTEAPERFDLVYVDGSHQAPDVLTDAILAFQLLKVGGLLVFDDYLWTYGGKGTEDFYNMPKPAIDAFVNVFRRKLTIFPAPLYQLYTQKTAA